VLSGLNRLFNAILKITQKIPSANSALTFGLSGAFQRREKSRLAGARSSNRINNRCDNGWRRSARRTWAALLG
jgi:hypothetical protein